MSIDIRETTYKQDMKIIPKDSLQYQHIKDYLATIESGNYFVLEDEIYQKTKLETQDNIQVVIPLIPNQKDKTRIVKMIAIRDTLNSLIKFYRLYKKRLLYIITIMKLKGINI